MLGSSDPHPDRRWVVAVAGIVHLRTVGDHGERIYLCPQCYLAAWWRDAVRDRGAAGSVYWHTHEEIHVWHNVPPPQAVPGQGLQKVLTAARAVLDPVEHAVGWPTAAAANRIVAAELILSDGEDWACDIGVENVPGRQENRARCFYRVGAWYRSSGSAAL